MLPAVYDRIRSICDYCEDFLEVTTTTRTVKEKIRKSYFVCTARPVNESMATQFDELLKHQMADKFPEIETEISQCRNDERKYKIRVLRTTYFIYDFEIILGMGGKVSKDVKHSRPPPRPQSRPVTYFQHMDFSRPSEPPRPIHHEKEERGTIQPYSDNLIEVIVEWGVDRDDPFIETFNQNKTGDHYKCEFVVDDAVDQRALSKFFGDLRGVLINYYKPIISAAPSSSESSPVVDDKSFVARTSSIIERVNRFSFSHPSFKCPVIISVSYLKKKVEISFFSVLLREISSEMGEITFNDSKDGKFVMVRFKTIGGEYIYHFIDHCAQLATPPTSESPCPHEIVARHFKAIQVTPPNGFILAGVYDDFVEAKEHKFVIKGATLELKFDHLSETDQAQAVKLPRYSPLGDLDQSKFESLSSLKVFDSPLSSKRKGQGREQKQQIDLGKLAATRSPSSKDERKKEYFEKPKPPPIPTRSPPVPRKDVEKPPQKPLDDDDDDFEDSDGVPVEEDDFEDAE
jgi:hypothetical protein